MFGSGVGPGVTLYKGFSNFDAKTVWKHILVLGHHDLIQFSS